MRLGPPEVIVERRPDGATILRSPNALKPYPQKLTERLAHWAQAAPERVFLAQRDSAGAWRTVTYAAAFASVRGIAAALLARDLSPERPIAILSGNDIEHALLGLAAMHIGVPYAPISVPYSLVSRDFKKLKGIIEILTPGLIFAADGTAFARAIAATVPPDVEVVVTANPASDRPMTPFTKLWRATDAGGRGGARQGRPRYHRQNPVHVRVHRPAEGRHQHPAHAVCEPVDDARRTGVPRRWRAAGSGRLAAVESHLRQQSRFQSGARLRRLALYRRGQADARRHRGHRAQSARHCSDDLFQRAEGLRDAAAPSFRRSGIARDVFQPPQGDVLCRRRSIAARARRAATARGQDRRRAHHFPDQPRLDGDGTGRAGVQLGNRARRQHGPAAARPGAQARSERGQARGAAQRP